MFMIIKAQSVVLVTEVLNRKACQIIEAKGTFQ